ncbi:hypothetical protein NE237_009119 [Protea cynaroides]|uniref:Uncharacterized protein n=1 Tax=Protea cynaroides TaxID=273540 RepID=A0A9Q0KXZ0_9MAGN|nr:hypothetical protein NE237_009119 [Protea cynaroides]
MDAKINRALGLTVAPSLPSLCAVNPHLVIPAPKATNETDAQCDSSIPVSSSFRASPSTSTAVSAIPTLGESSDSSLFGAASLFSTTAPSPFRSSLTSTFSSLATDAFSFPKLFSPEFEDSPRTSGVSPEFMVSCFTSVLSSAIDCEIVVL